MKVESSSHSAEGQVEKVSDSEQRREKQRAKYIWRCEICGRCLCSKRSYSEHKNTHNAARPFKCDSCDYAAASQMTLRRHTLRQHVPRSHWHYPCPHCEQAFVEPTSYQAHLRHKHTGYSGTFGCDKCEYRTLSSKNFVDHIFKLAHVRAKKHPASKTIRDFTDRTVVCKYLVDDELGVGWGQRSAEDEIDEQELSLRRLTYVEQERRRRQPVIMSVYSRQQHRLQPRIGGGRTAGMANSARTGKLQTSTVNSILRPDVGVAVEYDHEYQTNAVLAPTRLSSRGHRVSRLHHSIGGANGRRVLPVLPNIVVNHAVVGSTLPSTSALGGCLVPEAECYVEVATAPELEPSVTGVEDAANDNNTSSSDSGSDNEEVDDDDSVSCSSDSSVEIGLRLNALTAEIGMEADEAIEFVQPCDQGCQDLGNDVLPDGQVDFDLD